MFAISNDLLKSATKMFNKFLRYFAVSIFMFPSIALALASLPKLLFYVWIVIYTGAILSEQLRFVLDIFFYSWAKQKRNGIGSPHPNFNSIYLI